MFDGWDKTSDAITIKVKNSNEEVLGTNDDTESIIEGKLTFTGKVASTTDQRVQFKSITSCGI